MLMLGAQPSPDILQVESMVRVLQLVSVLVEVLGDHMKDHLPTIAAALPQVPDPLCHVPDNIVVACRAWVLYAGTAACVFMHWLQHGSQLASFGAEEVLSTRYFSAWLAGSDCIKPALASSSHYLTCVDPHPALLACRFGKQHQTTHPAPQQAPGHLPPPPCPGAATRGQGPDQMV
jgi:hypothetical protein